MKRQFSVLCMLVLSFLMIPLQAEAKGKEKIKFSVDRDPSSLDVQDVLSGQNDVDLARIKITVSKDITVRKLKVNANVQVSDNNGNGKSDVRDIRNVFSVKAYHNDVFVGDGTIKKQKGKVFIVFKNSFLLSAGTSQLVLRSDISDTAVTGDKIKLSLKSRNVTFQKFNKKVKRKGVAKGSVVRVEEVQAVVTQVEFKSLGVDTVLNRDDTFQEIGKFRLGNYSPEKSVDVKKITFKNEGATNFDNTINNIVLYMSGEQVSSETQRNGDFITFLLDNDTDEGFVLENGDSRIFSIRADINVPHQDDYVNLFIAEAGDVSIVEKDTNISAELVSNTTTTLSFNEEGLPVTSDVEGGTYQVAFGNLARLRAYKAEAAVFKVSRDLSSLSNQDYASGTNDIPFLFAQIVPTEQAIVEGFDLSGIETIGMDNVSDLNTIFEDLRVYANDTYLGDAVFTNTGSLLFETTFEINGTTVLNIIGNISNEAKTGMEIRLNLQATDFLNPEFINSGQSIQTENLVGNAQASWVRIKETIITVERTDDLGSAQKLVAGVDDVTLMAFSLENNEAGDVVITSVSVQAEGTGNGAQYSYYTLAVFVDGMQQGSSKNLTSNGAATFNDISVIIESEGMKEFTLVGDTIELIAPGIVEFNIMNIDVDNVENGMEGTVENLPVSSSTFTFIESGTLAIDPATFAPASTELNPGQTDIEVARIIFTATDDDIEVKDLYFKNNVVSGVHERVDFRLKYMSGERLDQTVMFADGSLHFELSNAGRIVIPQGESVTVSVTVDVRSITEEDQNGHQLELAVDVDKVGNDIYFGFEADTVATGADLNQDHITLSHPLVGPVFTVQLAE